jgi:hypothetical protein
MAMYATDLLTIALELAQHNVAYEDVASRFLEHFVAIAHSAIGGTPFIGGGTGGTISGASSGSGGLWHEEDGWFYDYFTTPGSERQPVRLKSIVGLIPLLAACTIDEALLDKLPAFKARMQWFIRHRSVFTTKHHVVLPSGGVTSESGGLLSRCTSSAPPGDPSSRGPSGGGRRLLSLVPLDDIPRLLARLLDPAQFLSTYGIRSLSKEHASTPFVFRHGAYETTVEYAPAESPVALFGSNSNWRGPVWLALNFMLVEKLRCLHAALGPAYTVEFPTGSGARASLLEVSQDLSERMVNIFRVDPSRGVKPVDGSGTAGTFFSTHPRFAGYTSFFEYFDGDTGRGLGASHQTGWTALVSKLLHADSI